MKKTILCSFALLVSVNIANSAISLTENSSSFDYRYEMDLQPNNQNLDGAGGDDWFDTGVPTVSLGFAANTVSDQLFRGDFSGSIWRNVANTSTADWTLEISVAKTGGVQGTNGWFGIFSQNVGATVSSALYLRDDRVVLEQGATDLTFLTGSFPSANQNTIRIAHDSVANSFYYWVNGVLLNTNLSTPFTGLNGNINSGGSTFIGDYSSSLAGNYSIDYIRLDTVASAPIPEPAAALLGSLGVLILLLRRRRSA